MIFIKENKRGEERHTWERRESSKSRIIKVPLWAIYTHSKFFVKVGFGFVTLMLAFLPKALTF